MKSANLLLLFLGAAGFASSAKILQLDERKMGHVSVTLGRSTILSFPSRPSKVILGNQGAFKVEYVENDIAIAATSSASRSNIFVYVNGRRFAFDLVVGAGDGDDIVIVKDQSEIASKVKVQ